MAIEIEPEDHSKPVRIETMIHSDLSEDFEAYCSSIDSSKTYVLAKVIAGFVKEKRKQIDDWKAKKKDETPHAEPEQAVESKPRTSKRAVKNAAAEGQQTQADDPKPNGIHMDTRQSPAGGAVLGTTT